MASTSSSNISHTDDRQLAQRQDHANLNRLEHFPGMARSWTLADSVRILRRMNRQIEDRAEGGGPFDWTWTDPDEEYDEQLRRAIDRDIDFLRSCDGALSVVPGEDWTEQDEGVLFCEILNEIDSLVMRWKANMLPSSSSYSDSGLTQEIESLMSSLSVDGDSFERRVSEYLKTRTCCDEDEVNINGICSVCLDQLYQENGRIATLECGHEFHVECIKKWLKEKNACPLCKAKALPIDDD